MIALLNYQIDMKLLLDQGLVKGAAITVELNRMRVRLLPLVNSGC
jgi:hypothetical protein